MKTSDFTINGTEALEHSKCQIIFWVCPSNTVNPLFEQARISNTRSLLISENTASLPNFWSVINKAGFLIALAFIALLRWISLPLIHQISSPGLDGVKSDTSTTGERWTSNTQPTFPFARRTFAQFPILLFMVCTDSSLYKMVSSVFRGINSKSLSLELRPGFRIVFRSVTLAATGV